MKSPAGDIDTEASRADGEPNVQTAGANYGLEADGKPTQAMPLAQCITVKCYQESPLPCSIPSPSGGDASSLSVGFGASTSSGEAVPLAEPSMCSAHWPPFVIIGDLSLEEARWLRVSGKGPAASLPSPRYMWL